MIRRLLLLLVPLSLLVAACGGGGDDDSSSSSSSGSASGSTTGDAAFPVTIEHKYGETTIEEEPVRVVSVGFVEQDTLLALGVVPVGIREWYGEQPFATWPWAQELLGDAEPEVLAATEINFEAVAALQPDLIVGMSSGMTETEYETLSGIAPTLPQSGEFVDYGMPWQDATRMAGTALGRSDRAEELIAAVEDRYAEIRDAYPELRGATATVSYVLDEANIGAYGPEDSRSRLLQDLGMVIPDEIIDAAGDQFYSAFSWEQIELLDHDVLIWIGGENGVREQIESSPLRQELRAAIEGREIFLDPMEGGAASFSSVLSLPYLLDSLVPKLAAAVDGDPATAVAS